MADQCIHDLPAGTCVSCRMNGTRGTQSAYKRRSQKRIEQEEERGRSAGKMIARYSSLCACGSMIKPGDWIFRIDGVWACEWCAESHDSVNAAT